MRSETTRGALRRAGALLLVAAAAASLGADCGQPSEMSYLSNGVIQVGVDLKRGGTITFLADAANLDVNLVNSADLGREIQQSYYSGPHPYGDPHPGWPNWGWNPIGAGDAYDNPAEVLEHVNDGTTLYVRSIPKQWALDDVPCECIFEKWLTLDGNAVRARYRLVNARSDTTIYPPADQELPAAYTTDRFHRLFAYTGASPYTNGALTEIQNSGPPWAYFQATERWAALVQDNGWGLGVWNPVATQFVGGFHGTPGDGDPRGGSTGYIAPLRRETILHDTVYEYEAHFILGYLHDIRAYVYAHR